MRAASLELPIFSYYVGSRSYSLASNPFLPSRRITRSDFTQAQRVPLLVLNMEPTRERFYLSQTAKNYLNSLQGQCYIVSVSGRPVIGKSSLLNLLLSIFNWDETQGEVSYRDIYTIGDENVESTTEGIDMYCLSANGKNYIFLDVEGDNDSGRGQTGTWIYTNLIRTAIGVSHVHLYNYNGVPQQSNLAYFETITRVVRQYDTPDDFETRYTFLRRDFFIKDQGDRIQKLQIATNSLRNKADLNFSLHFVPTPPEHITQKNSKTSCIASKRVLCQDCQDHEFTSMLFEIRDELKQQMDQAAPFQSGRDLCRSLEQLIEINRTEIPFFLDTGYISEIRLSRIIKDKQRIIDGLTKVGKYQADNSLYEEVQRIIEDHPSLLKKEKVKDSNEAEGSEESKNSNEAGGLEESKSSIEMANLANNQESERSLEESKSCNKTESFVKGKGSEIFNEARILEESEDSNEAENLENNQLMKDFKKAGGDLEIKVAQIEYLVVELSKFIDQYLLDDKASILNEKEKKALREAYIDRFNSTLKEVVALFKKYDEVIEFIYQKLLKIQAHITTNLKKYLKIVSDTHYRTFTLTADAVSTAGLGILAREAVGKLLFVVCGVGGAIGAGLTIFFFIRAYLSLKRAIQENNELLNRDKIGGIEEIKSLAKEMKRMEEFVTKLIEGFEKNRETLKKICSEDQNEHVDLMVMIEEAMEDKIRRVNLSPENRDQLVEKLNVIEDNLEKFKQCL